MRNSVGDCGGDGVPKQRVGVQRMRSIRASRPRIKHSLAYAKMELGSPVRRRSPADPASQNGTIRWGTGTNLALPPFNREELLCELFSRGGGQFLWCSAGSRAEVQRWAAAWGRRRRLRLLSVVVFAPLLALFSHEGWYALRSHTSSFSRASSAL